MDESDTIVGKPLRGEDCEVVTVNPNAETDTVECSHGGHANHTPDPNSGLGRRALALRGAHILIAIVEIASVAHLWVCAITGRRDRALTGAMVVLGIEGAALIVTRGDCPLGPLQARLGDPTPLFELALPPAAEKLAVCGGEAGGPCPCHGDLGRSGSSHRPEAEHRRIRDTVTVTPGATRSPGPVTPLWRTPLRTPGSTTTVVPARGVRPEHPTCPGSLLGLAARVPPTVVLRVPVSVSLRG